jgi:hypothetical protein
VLVMRDKEKQWLAKRPKPFKTEPFPWLHDDDDLIECNTLCCDTHLNLRQPFQVEQGTTAHSQVLPDRLSMR